MSESLEKELWENKERTVNAPLNVATNWSVVSTGIIMHQFSFVLNLIFNIPTLVLLNFKRSRKVLTVRISMKYRHLMSNYTDSSLRSQSSSMIGLIAGINIQYWLEHCSECSFRVDSSWLVFVKLKACIYFRYIILNRDKKYMIYDVLAHSRTYAYKIKLVMELTVAIIYLYWYTEYSQKDCPSLIIIDKVWNNWYL